AKKAIQEDRTLEVKTLNEQIALYKAMGNEGEVKETRKKLLALYATPLPQPDMPITAEADPPSSKQQKIVPPSENGASIDLTESGEGASAPENDEGDDGEDGEENGEHQFHDNSLAFEASYEEDDERLGAGYGDGADGADGLQATGVPQAASAVQSAIPPASAGPRAQQPVQTASFTEEAVSAAGTAASLEYRRVLALGLGDDTARDMALTAGKKAAAAVLAAQPAAHVVATGTTAGA
ncbi:unnamed protein product, partial [Ectocarpus sp. 13 AM-2016]